MINTVFPYACGHSINLNLADQKLPAYHDQHCLSSACGHAINWNLAPEM